MDWTHDPVRAELRSIYDELDDLLAPYSCEGSGECCDASITGREPHPTAVELAEVFHAARARSALVTKRRLPLLEKAGRCKLLDERGRCRIYASRPFGCRTYFCNRITGPGRPPRGDIQRLSRAVADLSQKAFPRDSGPRSLFRALVRSEGKTATSQPR